MTSFDFVHSGPHDALIAGGAAESNRSPLRIVASRIAGAVALGAIVLAVMALRYWIYLPILHHGGG
jgi:hypothetical protein